MKQRSLGFPQDIETAIKYYQKALPHPHALTRLMRLAMTGQKIPKLETILSLCENSMKLTSSMPDCAHAELLLTLSFCYETGQVLKKDAEQAKHLLQQVEIAAKTEPEIACKLAFHLLAVTADFKNPQLALNLFLTAAQEGSTAAALLLAKITHEGLYGAAKSSKLVVELLSSPLLQNIPYANYLLALEYLSSKDPAESKAITAAKLLQQAANAIVPEACILLAKYYLSGENKAIPKDVSTGLYYLDKLMKLHYPPAFNALAECYLQGKGVPKDLAKARDSVLKLEKLQKKLDPSSVQLLSDIAMAYYKIGNTASYKQAFDLWQITAKQDHAESHIHLYGMYYHGRGVAKDIQKGVQQHLMRAADLNHPEAFYYLGRNYDNSFGKIPGFEKNQKLAVKYHEKGVALKHGPSFFGLALCYANGNGVSKNLNKAVELLKKGSDLNDVESKEKLASCYKTGLWGEKGNQILAKDMALAIKLWKEAAALGSATANYELGLIYEQGLIDPKLDKNIKLAYEHFEKGMNLGSLAAKCKIGISLYKGLGVTQDQKAAFEIFQQLNAAKHPEGIYWQGVCFASGSAVEQDLKIAFELYKQAAHLNYPQANCIIGYAYRYGLHDHPKDPEKAFTYFSRAASYQNSEGLYLLGTCYEKGLGLDASLMSNMMERYRLSYMHYQRALELGFEAATKPRDRMYTCWQKEKESRAAALPPAPLRAAPLLAPSLPGVPASSTSMALKSRSEQILSSGLPPVPPGMLVADGSGSAEDYGSYDDDQDPSSLLASLMSVLEPEHGSSIPGASLRGSSSLMLPPLVQPSAARQQSNPIVFGYSSVSSTPLPTGTAVQNRNQQPPGPGSARTGLAAILH